MKRWCVVEKISLTIIIRSFKSRAEAQGFITDCFGPEWDSYTILEINVLEGVL